MPKTLYQLLEIAPSAGADEIKRAFRMQIARYHPDKVQHLGQEFQDMAVQRAAELTEAYRVLSDEQHRAAYDQALAAKQAMPTPVPVSKPPHTAAPAAAAAHPGVDSESRPGDGRRFAHERAERDRVVRKAAVHRFDRALAGAAAGYHRTEARGFDYAWTPKNNLFGRSKGPRLAARLVPRVDGDSIAAAFADAGKWSAGEVCVFLMGDDLATAGELARAIASERRRPAAARVSVVPLDARTWEAHLPAEAPPIAKSVLERVRSGG